MKWAAVIFVTIIAALFFLVQLIDGINEVGITEAEGKSQLQNLYSKKFASKNCDRENISSAEGNHTVVVNKGSVTINHMTCDITNMFIDIDLYGVGFKLKNCKPRKELRGIKRIVLTPHNGEDTLMHMSGWGQHHHLCSFEKIKYFKEA